MAAIPTLGLIGYDLPSPPPWARAEGYFYAKPLDDDEHLWLVVRPQITNLALAVCTLPPLGGFLEHWDYAPGLEGALDCVRAYKLWPRRDADTETWIRHTILYPEHAVRYQRRATDIPPEGTLT